MLGNARGRRGKLIRSVLLLQEAVKEYFRDQEKAFYFEGLRKL